jgi:hypothetical protein
MLKHDTATTSDYKHSLDVSVLHCDHEDCGESLLIGPGMGDTLSGSEVKDIEDCGWSCNDSGDYCPKHKALHEHDDEVDGE